MTTELTTALFPLSVHVLPGGKLPLRIFEARYTRMIKEAATKQRDFSMCMLDTAAKPGTLMNMFPLVTLVRIVDFDPLPDGLLKIIVEGQSIRRLSRVWEESDGLKVGHSVPHEAWSPMALRKEQQGLSRQLQRLYLETDSLKELDLAFEESSASWLCQRWLELLPMNPDDKQLLIEQSDCKAALAFLSKVIRTHGACE